MKEDYSKARRMGLRTCRRNIRQGRSPYLLALESFLPRQKMQNPVSLGLCEIPVSLIAGTLTAERSNAFASDFLPSGARCMTPSRRKGSASRSWHMSSEIIFMSRRETSGYRSHGSWEAKAFTERSTGSFRNGTEAKRRSHTMNSSIFLK